MSVAIAGAGLSGLCLTHALLRAGVDVQVYERDSAPDTRRQGYRITVDEHGIGALQRCLPVHLFQLFLATAGEPGGSFRFTNRELGDIFRLTFETDPSRDNLAVPRQADRQTLRAILLCDLRDRVHFGKTAVGLDHLSEKPTLHFADGSSASASLVVGADGANSSLRHQLLPECSPIDTGSIAIYGRSPAHCHGCSIVPSSLERSGVLAIGAPGHGFFFTTMHFHESPAAAFARLAPGHLPPVTDDYIMWALLFPTTELPPNVHDLSAEALHRLTLAAAGDFHPVLRRFVECADIEYTMAVPIRSATRPSTWPVSCATLMGDAAHVMPPFGAHGGNTALRDAALLSEKLVAAFSRGGSLENDDAAIHDQESASSLGDASSGAVVPVLQRNAIGARNVQLARHSPKAKANQK